MAMAPQVGMSRVFVVVNAKSGNSSPEEIRRAWKAHQAEGSGEYRIRAWFKSRSQLRGG